MSKLKQTEIGKIPEDWDLFAINDVAEIVGGGTPSTKEPSNFGGDIPWITPKDLSNYPFRYISRGERNITQRGIEESSAKLLPPNTVLLTTRAPVGYVAISNNEVATNQGFRSLIPRQNASSEYLYYLLKNNTERLKSNASGTTFGELSGSTLKSLRFPFPQISEQCAITKILSDLDDKIELNRQMNKTLESIAQAIFKRWFVDFEFPNEKNKSYKSSGGKMVNSEVGKIPKGWKVSRIGDELKTVLGGTPSTTNKSYWENGTIAWINSGKINEFRITEPTEYITQEALDNSATKLLPKRTTVIAITGATLGQVSLLEIESCANQSVVGVLETKEMPSEYIYFWVKSTIDKIISWQTGGAQQHINKENINSSSLLIPNQGTLLGYLKIAKPLFNQIRLNCFENMSLSQIRDSLLPKLMSGKIRIKS